MKKDKKIEKLIKEITEQCQDFTNSVDLMGNQCAWTDRKIEAILKKTTELKKAYESNDTISSRSFNHFDEVWEYLNQFKTKEELEKAFEDIPSKFGSFFITHEEEDGFEICNSYWDKAIGEHEENFYWMKKTVKDSSDLNENDDLWEAIYKKEAWYRLEQIFGFSKEDISDELYENTVDAIREIYENWGPLGDALDNNIQNVIDKYKKENDE